LALLLRRTSWSRAVLSFALRLSDLLGEDLVAVYVSASPDETVDGYNALVVVREPERVEMEVVALASDYGISPAVLREEEKATRSA